MKYGVICAMDEELAILKDSLENSQRKEISGTQFFSGEINNQPVVLVKSGIGKVAAGINTAVLIDEFKVDAVINSGSAGGIGQGLKVGDIVISTQTAYHDVDVTPAGYKIGQLPDCPQIFQASPTLVDGISKAAKKSGLLTHQGLIVSGDQFIADKKKIAIIKKNFPDALACEMEGAAVGQVAYMKKTPYVVIRAMSDVGDENANQSFDEFIVEAGKRSGKMLINFFNSEK